MFYYSSVAHLGALKIPYFSIATFIQAAKKLIFLSLDYENPFASNVSSFNSLKD